MVYAFEDIKTGKQVDWDFPLGEAPKVGEEVMLDGRLCRRIASFVLDSAGIARKTHQYPYVSNRLSRNTEGCKLVKDGSRMKPMIESPAHEREVMAKNDLQRDGEGV